MGGVWFVGCCSSREKGSFIFILSVVMVLVYGDLSFFLGNRVGNCDGFTIVVEFVAGKTKYVRTLLTFSCTH